MICYKDKCWCSAESCEQYEWCKNSFTFAVKEQEQTEKDKELRLPYATRDMSEVCRWYKCKNER